jgi:hypothetical protein
VLGTRRSSHGTNSALHVASSSGEGDCNTAGGSTASLDTLLDAIVDVNHVKILAVGVATTVNVEGSIVRGGVVLAVAGGARDGR